MSALRSLINPRVHESSVNSVTRLYRTILKEVPRVLALFDVDMDKATARKAIKYQFTKHGPVQDKRVVELLVAKGYMELEETLMQWKQYPHLMEILEPFNKVSPRRVQKRV